MDDVSEVGGVGDAPQRTGHGPLAGFTVGVTAARRADELGALLQRRGATVLHAPALRIVPLADDGELMAATKRIVDRAPDVVVATTAIGFRGWVEAADGWGLGETLLERLRTVELLARGPKVKGAVRAAGLRAGGRPPRSPWPRSWTGSWKRASTRERCEGFRARKLGQDEKGSGPDRSAPRSPCSPFRARASAGKP
ncbi:hypothetical protein SVIOM342S_00303 [Streptomyces violaceorubidus]